RSRAQGARLRDAVPARLLRQAPVLLWRLRRRVHLEPVPVPRGLPGRALAVPADAGDVRGARRCAAADPGRAGVPAVLPSREPDHGAPRALLLSCPAADRRRGRAGVRSMAELAALAGDRLRAATL